MPNWGYAIVSVVAAAAALYFLWHDKNQSGARRGFTAFLIAAFFGLLANADSIESVTISTSVISAKTREAKALVDDAKRALDGLHQLAKTTGSVLVDMIAAGSRWGGGDPYLTRDAQKARVFDVLKSIGLSSEQIKEVSEADSQWVKIDYVEGIFAGFKPPADQNDKWTKTWAPWNQTTERPTPDECQRILEQFNITDPMSRELLEDYRYCVKTGEHRRPEVWRDREKWMSR